MSKEMDIGVREFEGSLSAAAAASAVAPAQSVSHQQFSSTLTNRTIDTDEIPHRYDQIRFQQQHQKHDEILDDHKKHVEAGNSVLVSVTLPMMFGERKRNPNIKHQRYHCDDINDIDEEKIFSTRKLYATTTDGVGSRQQVVIASDPFSRLSDEIILHIFKWLPKKSLIRCSLVNRRFARCACDESLWTRLNLGGRSLRSGALENVLTRGVIILRLARTMIKYPVFDDKFLQNDPEFETKLQYLDLSMAEISKSSLRMLLARCRLLKKLSLEHVPINDEICIEIAKNQNLETLNLTMSSGLEAWSIQSLFESLKNLDSLNISWTGLSVDAVAAVVTHVTPNLMRLNMAGCRKTMFDSHLSTLSKRCQRLLELDLSDCTALTGNVVAIICQFQLLEYLSLSRCYLISSSAIMELRDLQTLNHLDVFGMLSDPAMEMIMEMFPDVLINKCMHSSIARPTVGKRRTSIWGLRTRD